MNITSRFVELADTNGRPVTNYRKSFSYNGSFVDTETPDNGERPEKPRWLFPGWVGSVGIPSGPACS